MKKIVMILSFVAISAPFFCSANTPYKQAQEMCAEEGKRAKRTTAERSTITFETNSYNENNGGQNYFRVEGHGEANAKLNKTTKAGGSVGGTYERKGEQNNTGTTRTSTEYFECE